MKKAVLKDSGLRVPNQKGVALLMALIITLVVFLLIGSTIYMVTLSTTMSGAGKRYASASEAADGAVNIVKESINLARGGEQVLGAYKNSGNCIEGSTIQDRITKGSLACTAELDLPGTFGASYEGMVSVQRVFTADAHGSRIEFARAGGSGGGGRLIFYRITVLVKGKNPSDATAENSVLYRYKGL